MITPSFGLTATERVLPKLALDFTTGILDPRITFTRSDATATRINSSGFIESVAADTARFNYNPVSFACQGLLIEETRQNLFKYSNKFDDDSWGKQGVNVSVVSNTSPDGASSIFKVTPQTSVQTFKELQQNVSITSNVTYCISMYIKPDNYRYVQILGASAGFGTFYVNFDLLTGTETAFDAGSSTVVGRGIINSGNGFYRIWAAVKALSTTSSRMGFDYIGAATDVRGAPWTANGTDGYLIYGMQFEAGAFPTSYIPTTSAALTRNADVATMTGTNFSDWWTATTGSANVLVISKSASGTKPFFQMDDNTADNIISLRGNVANPELYIKATTDQAQIDVGTIVANTAYKLAGAWNTNNCAAAQNGAAVVTDTSATIPTVTQARIGSDGTNYANGLLQKINYWPQCITDNETQAFSK